MKQACVAKCGSGARVDSEIHKELSDLGII